MRSKYTWCLHCETVHLTDSWRKSKGFCPKCGASGIVDGWPWPKLVKANGYPRVPVEGRAYELYPREKKV